MTFLKYNLFSFLFQGYEIVREKSSSRPEHWKDGKEWISDQKNPASTIVEQVKKSEEVQFWFPTYPKIWKPVVWTYGSLLLCIVPVAAVQRSVMCEGEKTPLWKLQKRKD